MYPHYSGVVDRLISLVPAPRVVYIVREPIARMRSAYRHALAAGAETRPIATALTADPRYLLTSSYALQLEQWLQAVPRNRVLLLSLEELRDHPDAICSRLFGFLDIDPTWRPPGLGAANVSEGKQAPRGWWRALGAATLRAGKTDWIPDWMVRLNDSRSRLVHRDLSELELTVPPQVETQLRRALAPDLARLADHWGESEHPEWLQSEADTRHL
jgi:hypothetical protein